jgi:hypothetical protein
MGNARHFMRATHRRCGSGSSQVICTQLGGEHAAINDGF